MTPWAEDPSPSLCAVFGDIARTRMADVPICNRALQVEAIAFRRLPEGPWVGVMITPWAINLLCLPAEGAAWPDLPACSKYSWQFPSGFYEFTVAEEARLGIYHLCSLFSPAQEFPSQEQARLTALAIAHALFGQPIDEPAEPPATVEKRPSRRAFLGLGR
ncbi:[NiFe]-hydrogenase assembly chaperone HybE [Dechloromonas sp. ZS-1]|uniref:[NiFe]-hydrogenase assembly chaperone HybE n=1 Tax=Dechloromonas sp. ZS-1 TaxID=3138067 RepID=UPI0031FBAE9E